MFWGVGFGRRGLWALIGSLLLAGCGSPDYVTDNLARFLVKHEEDLVRAIEQEYDRHNYKTMVHIQFEPNDFGSQAGSEVFRTLDGHLLSEDSAALEITESYRKKNILFSIRYRHNSADRAVKAFAQAFACKNGSSQKLNQVFILGSGGSHGADELDDFSDRLSTVCGRRVNFAILSDGISQPVFFAKTSMRFLQPSKDLNCVNIYQNQFDNILKGSPMSGCVNVRLDSGISHVAAAELARYLVTDLLTRLDLRTRPWRLQEFGDEYLRVPDYGRIYFEEHPEKIPEGLTSKGFAKRDAAEKAIEKILERNPAQGLAIVDGLNPEEIKWFLSFILPTKTKMRSLLAEHFLASSDPDRRFAVGALIRKVGTFDEISLRVLNALLEDPDFRGTRVLMMSTYASTWGLHGMNLYEKAFEVGPEELDYALISFSAETLLASETDLENRKILIPWIQDFVRLISEPRMSERAKLQAYRAAYRMQDDALLKEIILKLRKDPLPKIQSLAMHMQVP